jgi:hypothetical protein
MLAFTRIGRFLPIVGSVAVVGAVASCAADDSVKWVAGFDPPPAPQGYTRLIAATVPDIVPGADVEMCQWVAAPSDQDRDVLAMDGYQSKGGHHAILYATTETGFKVGESHVCTVTDMISLSYVAGIGGEGGSPTQSLPAGVYFHVPAGQMLMVNSHWLNAGETTVDGQAVFDVEFAAPSNRIIADLFANTIDQISLPSGQLTKLDATCVMPQDMTIALIGNHMHWLGTSAYTEFIQANGTKQMIVTDDPWATDEQFNPKFSVYPLSSPLLINAGDTYHTHCEWQNTTPNTVTFPDEMCAGFAFYFPSMGSKTCVNGSF